MLSDMLKRDRDRWGMSVGEAGLAARDHAPGVRRDRRRRAVAERERVRGDLRVLRAGRTPDAAGPRGL